MNEFYTVLSAVLPVFCLAIVGVVLRKVEWLTEEADASLMRVVVNVLTPALILDKVLGNEALRRPENLLLPPVLGFGGVALGVRGSPPVLIALDAGHPGRGRGLHRHAIGRPIHLRTQRPGGGRSGDSAADADRGEEGQLR